MLLDKGKNTEDPNALQMAIKPKPSQVLLENFSNLIPSGLTFESERVVSSLSRLLLILEFIAQCSIYAVKDIWAQMRLTDYVMDPPLNPRDPSCGAWVKMLSALE